MTNPRHQSSEESPPSAKRKRVMAAVAQEIVTSEDDDNVTDGLDICDIIENHTDQHRQTDTASALHALGETLRNTLLEINEIREQNRERRHRELLQILTKMVQQECQSKAESSQNIVTSFNSESATNALINTANNVVNFMVDQNLSDKDQHLKSLSPQTINSSASGSFEANTSQSQLRQILSNQKFVTTAPSTPKYIKILPKTQLVTKSNSQQMFTDKNVIPDVKQNNPKEEFDKMRAQMLELQRQKMEDRERKKREFLQMQNSML